MTYYYGRKLRCFTKPLCLLFLATALLAGCSKSQRTIENPAINAAGPKSAKTVNFATSSDAAAEEVLKEPAGPLTLRDALKLTLVHNPELKAYSYGIRAAEARHFQAGLRPNPDLSIDIEDIGGSGDMKGFDSAETTIQLSQLFDFAGTYKKSQRVAHFDTKLAESDYQMKRLDLSVSVTKSFVELLFLQEKLVLSENLIDVSKAVIDSVNKRVEAGRDTPLDLLKAKVRLEKAMLHHHEIEQQINSLRIQLASYWSGKTPVFSTAAGRLDRIVAVPGIAQLQAQLQNSPEILQWAFEIQKRDAQLQVAKAESKPGITISGGVKHFNFDDDTAFVVGLSIPLPVTDRNQGGRLEAMHHLNMAKQQEEALMQSTWSRLQQLHNQLQTAYRQATVLKNEILAASEKIFNASKVSYEEGKIGYLELLDAQRNYFASKDEYIDVLAKYHLCKTELERLVGHSLTINESENQ